MGILSRLSENVNPSPDHTTPQVALANLCEGQELNGHADGKYNMLQTALWYARGGWHVFPCVPGDKKPITEHGLKDATRDLAIITDWWTRTPNANIGLNAGLSGLMVVDFDTYKPEFAGGDLLARLLADHPTTTADSARGGVHLLYKQPAKHLGCSRGSLPVGVDPKGAGGYIILAPSLPNENGQRYMWRDGLGPHDQKPQPLPAFLLEILQNERKPEKKTAMHTNGAAPYALTDDYEKAKNALAFVGKWRADDYNDWITVGMALRPLGDAGLALWDDWSSVSNKYTPGACADKWKTFADDGKLGIGSLVHWAKQDSPNIYTNGHTSTAPEMPDWMADAPPPAPDTIIDPETGEIIPLSKRPPAFAIIDEPEESDISSPLDITPVSGLDLGWVDRYAAVISEMTGSPVEFNRLAGLVTIATAIQRKAVLRMAFGDIYPNIYGCIVAPSSVFHKSSAIQKPRLLMNRADLGRLFLSELMTSEGLLKELRGQSSGVILRDEIGTLFDSHNTKYLRQLKPDLTAIFDCYPYSRRLSNEEIKVENPYLSILGATTPTRFYEGISLTDWTDGFLARWLFVTPESEPNFDAMTSLYTKKHDEKVTQLSWKLQEINRRDGADFVLEDEAHQFWDAWQRQAAKDAYYFGDDIAAAIVTRYSTYALKFAIILAACNGAWGTITADEMQTAIHLADSYKGYAHKLLQEKGNFGISGAKLQKVFMMVKRPPKSKDGKQLTATRKTLMQYANMKKGELDPCIEKLLEIGAIIENGKRFAPAVDELPVKSWK